MLNIDILSGVTFIYFLAFIFYLSMMVMGKKILGPIASIITLAGFIANTAGIAMRWRESYELGIGRIPLTNLYESLIFFAWTIILLYLFMEWRLKNRSIGAFVTPLAFLALAYASFSEKAIHPLIPALQSNWLTVHVATCFLGYAAFALSFGISVMFLVKGADTGKSLFFRIFPDKSTLDELNYRMVIIGFLMLTLGIITGSVWANSAWGSYWSWDPKETWSLVTWFVYAAMLHSRLISGWKGRRLALFSIIGFFCVLFTYFGVNFLLSGLHSYGS